jgi:translation elongation factor EF-Ts
VLVEYEGVDASAARGAAMQIAAMRPKYISRDEVPADLVENERRIAEAAAKEEGKPEQAVPKIVEGRLNAFFKDVALLDQPSVTDARSLSVSSSMRQESRYYGSYASRRPGHSRLRRLARPASVGIV